MRGFSRRAWLFVREHGVLVAAALAATASMVAVAPDEAYWSYFDWRTLECLFCVLTVASAFRLMGAFDHGARAIIGRFRTPSALALALVLTTAALSMVATNDMALIMMLPLSAATLMAAGQARILPAVFALQGIAANLCGMIMPFGNPQNLYLYSYYDLGLRDFLGTMALPFAVSTAGVIACTLTLTRAGSEEESGEKPQASTERDGTAASGAVAGNARGAGTDKAASPDSPAAVARKSTSLGCLSRRRLVAYLALFLLTILAVFGVVPSWAATLVVIAVLAATDRRALASVDYPLLLTFACFFVFAGNLARLPELNAWLGALMADHGLLASAGLSQIISNVPAAVLLSHFTSAWQPLLVGVNIGGAGTLVGSLASLITLQHFTSVRKIFPQARTLPELSTARFLGLFATLNFAFLALLLVVCSLGVQ
ncbi:SLC13 family permease [Adlercreutzia sp. R7]|uniref:SLC13 family permease n=1 Tax=Adlercreutzia wanghongyangiae TaxID=3111451 RepID=A0ABU6II67_9ACTN|nr:SLC13 family permease [Adlercreutzia sp. R7]